MSSPSAARPASLLSLAQSMFGLIGVGAVAGAVYRTMFEKKTPHAPAARDAEAIPSAAARQAAIQTGAKPTARHMSWDDWKTVLKRIFQEVSKDRLLSIAAGTVFYALLALFPATTALVSSYGLFASPETIGGHLQFLSTMLPPGAFSIIQDQIARIVANGEFGLSLAFAVSFFLAVWSANAGMKAIIDALNVVYDEDEKRGFIRLNIVSLLMTFGAVLGALIVIGAVVVIPVALTFLGLDEGMKTILSLLRWPLLLVGMLAALALLYRFGPSRREPRWRTLTVGSVAATVLWLAGSAALSFYFANFADYNATYGSLAAVIGLMMWMWMSSIMVLLGAEINSEVERQIGQR